MGAREVREVGSIANDGEMGYEGIFTARGRSIALRVPPYVAVPNLYSVMLAEVLVDRGVTSLLDLGCGSGAIGILAGKESARMVSFSDIDRRAVGAAAANAALNDVRVEEDAFHESNWLEGLPAAAFGDSIVCSPPHTPRPPDALLSKYGWSRSFVRSSFAGIDGLSEISTILAQAARIAYDGTITMAVNGFLSSGLDSCARDLGFVSVAVKHETVKMSALAMSLRESIEQACAYEFPIMGVVQCMEICVFDIRRH
jgi:methylase of polypeptide subunit release factors